MKTTTKMTLSILLACTVWLVPAVVLAHPHLLDVKDKIEVSPEVMLDDLRQAQVIFVGEFHDHPGHHQAQLAIIDALDNDEDPSCDWSGDVPPRQPGRSGCLDRRKFICSGVYAGVQQNWGMWPVYSGIFMHARDEKLKLIGLNIPRADYRQGGQKRLQFVVERGAPAPRQRPVRG